MTADELASVTLEHLRHIRGRVDQIADDVGELKMRMSNVEAGITRIRRDVLQADETDIRQQIMLDKHVQNIIRTAESDLRHCQPRNEE